VLVISLLHREIIYSLITLINLLEIKKSCCASYVGRIGIKDSKVPFIRMLSVVLAEVYLLKSSTEKRHALCFQINQAQMKEK